MSRAGRKRKIGIKRQPNGQPSERDRPKQSAIDARMRVYGMSEMDANTDRAGHAIGRMALAGHFGRGQADYSMAALVAVDDYVKAVVAYMRIKCPQHPIPKAMDYTASRGSSLNGEPNLRTVDSVVERYERYVGGEHRKGILSQADDIDKMHFHNAAFHDIEPRDPLAVVRVVRIIMAA